MFALQTAVKTSLTIPPLLEGNLRQAAGRGTLKINLHKNQDQTATQMVQAF